MITNKITLLITLLFLNASLLAQEIRVDTIKTVNQKTITLVTVRTVPKFILQINGGFSFGALDLNGHNGGFVNSDFINGKTFGARNGIGGNIIFKIPFNKKGHFWLDILTGYNRFQSNLIIDNTKLGKVIYNQFFGGIGAEYDFTSYHRVKYYAGLSSLFSFIGGTASLLNSDETQFYDVKINQGFRIGYTIHMGLNYGFNKDIGWDLGFRFSHANLLLKKTVKPESIYETELNDMSTKPSELYSGWKQFAYVTIYTGISYFFNVKEKRYKLD